MVLKFLSVKSIVIAPAKIGKAKTNNIVVSNIDQTNSGILSIVIPGALMFKIVVIKFIELNMEEIPAR